MLGLVWFIFISCQNDQGVSELDLKLGQIVPKWDKPWSLGLFQIFFQMFFSETDLKKIQFCPIGPIRSNLRLTLTILE